MGKIK